MILISYDIANFYPNIKKETLEKAMVFAEQYCSFTDKEKEIILQSRKSFCFKNGTPWVKKDQDKNFDAAFRVPSLKMDKQDILTRIPSRCVVRKTAGARLREANRKQ